MTLADILAEVERDPALRSTPLATMDDALRVVSIATWRVALRASGGSVRGAAEALGISKSAADRQLRTLGLYQWIDQEWAGEPRRGRRSDLKK